MHLTNTTTGEILIIRNISMNLLQNKMYSVELLKFKNTDQLDRFNNNTLEEYEAFRSVIFYSASAIEEKLNGLVVNEYTVINSLLRAIYLAYISLNPNWEFVE